MALPVFQEYNMPELLTQPYNTQFCEQCGDYIKIKNYSGNAFGFPRHAIYESGLIFAKCWTPDILGYFRYDFLDSDYTHIGAQVRTLNRIEGPGPWYPAPTSILEDGSSHTTNNWDSSLPSRLRVATDTNTYKSGSSSIRFDFWGAGNMYADCEFQSYPSLNRFLLTTLRSTEANTALQLMLDLNEITDEERLVLAKHLSYDIILPEADKWYTIVWDLSYFHTYSLKQFGILFQNSGNPASVYLDNIEVGNYWTDVAKTPISDWYYKEIDFRNQLVNRDYFQYRILLASADRLNDIYSSPSLRSVVISQGGFGISCTESIPDLLRHSKYFEHGMLKFPVRSGPILSF